MASTLQAASDLQARAGVHAVGAEITKLGWIFREQTTSDYGIDALIEIVQAGGPSGRLIAAQIKSGASFFKERDGDAFIFRGDVEHLEYWSRHALPVILVVHDPRNDTAYFQPINADTVTRTKKGWKTRIPFTQVLSRSKKALESLTEASTYELRRRQLGLALPWMSLIAAGDRVVVEVEEWVNKSSGRGSFKFLRVNDGGDEDVIEEWPYQMYPGWRYPELFNHLFPWADVTIDEEFYDRKYDEDTMNMPSWMFPEPIEGEPDEHEPPEIRPYESNGEIDSYRLELRLNAVGKAFLELEKFLTSPVPRGESRVRPTRKKD